MTEPAPPPLDARRRRLLYRATHRGTAENDLMIGDYIRATVATTTQADLTALETLLDLPDSDLADWLMGRTPSPPAYSPTLNAMRSHALGTKTR